MGMNQERSLKSVVGAVWCGTAPPHAKKNIGKRIKKNAKEIVERARNEEGLLNSIVKCGRHTCAHVYIIYVLFG